jgi:hypothetical protein
MAILTWISAVLFPNRLIGEGIFNTPDVRVQTEFYEGEFHMGKHDLVVAPYGNDDNEGTLNAPLKTLKKAKEILRSIDDDENITIWFREGTYLIDETIQFTSDDKENVIYRSYPNEKVTFSGSKAISGWSEEIINGIKAYVVNVEINSDDDYFHSLYKGEKRLARSVYPKEGMFKVANPCNDDETVSEVYSPHYFTHSASFYAELDNVMNFENVQDVEVRIMHYWCDEHLPLHSVNASTGRIETAKPSSLTIRSNDNFVFENVKEALSLPGEWYLDRVEQKLYYIPEEGDTVENTILYAGINDKLLDFNGAKNISFQGIDFINTDWDYVGKDGAFFGKVFDVNHPLYKNIKYAADHPQAAFEVPSAIYIASSTGINFTDCCFENVSYTAIKFDKGSKNCNIITCEFNNIGANAVFIHGDNVVPATTKNINVTDCHIGYYGRIFSNAIGVLLTHAYDCYIKYNEIHDGWYTGISVGWNWGYAEHPTSKIEISNNLIYNIGNGWLSDMGGIYTLGAQPGTIISKNIIYNVGCDDGDYGYGGWGIYLDEGSSSIIVEDNLVYDCSSQTFHQHYGKDNVIRNNIFAFGGEGALIISKKEDHNSLTASNNILVTENTPMYAFETEKNWFIDDSNLYWDYERGGNVVSGRSMNRSDRKSLIALTAQGYYNNAIFKDPLFKDPQNRDFTLAENSPALENGFKPINYDAGTLTKFE